MYELKLGEDSYLLNSTDAKIAQDFSILSHVMFLQRYYNLFTGINFYEDDFPVDKYGNIKDLTFTLYQLQYLSKGKLYEYKTNLSTSDISIRMLT